MVTTSHQIWQGSTGTHSRQRQPSPQQSGNQIHSTGCGQLFILLQSHWHDHTSSPEQIIPTANKSNRKHDATMQAILGLHGNTSRCKNMILCIWHDINMHSDALYLSVPNACSKAVGIFFLGSLPQKNQPIFLNGAIHVLCTILRFVTASAAEAKLGAYFF